MSLSNLRRISCNVFSAGCRCQNVHTAMFCMPIAAKAINTTANASNSHLKLPAAAAAATIPSLTEVVRMKSTEANSTQRPHKSTTHDATTTAIKAAAATTAAAAVDEKKNATSQPPVSSKSTRFKSGVKRLFKKYGKVAVVFYLSLYITTLGSLFIALDFDLLRASTFGLDPVTSVKKVCDLFHSLTGSESLAKFIDQHPQAGVLALAWFMTKFTEPLRMAVSVAAVPPIANAVEKATGAKLVADIDDDDDDDVVTTTTTNSGSTNSDVAICGSSKEISDNNINNINESSSNSDRISSSSHGSDNAAATSSAAVAEIAQQRQQQQQHKN